MIWSSIHSYFLFIHIFIDAFFLLLITPAITDFFLFNLSSNLGGVDGVPIWQASIPHIPGRTGFWSSAIANDWHFKAAIIVYPGVQQEKEIQ